MKIEILDNINEKPNLNIVGFGQRLGAYLVDIIPIILFLNIIIYLAYGINPLDSEDRVVELGGQEYYQSKILRSLVRYLSFFIWILYCSVMEASSYNGTFGKRMLGIRVVDPMGEQLSLGNAIQRNLFKIISYLPLGLGFLWPLFDKQNRSWHDMLAKTFVVK